MRRVPEGSLNRFLLIFLLILPNITYALEQPREGLLDYTIEVSFDIQASKIKGVVTIPVKKGQEMILDKGELTLRYVILDKQHLDISEQKGILRILSSREGTLEIKYEGVFQEPSSSFLGEQSSSLIGEKGIFLTGTWYPKPRQMCRYHLTATLPNGYEAVSEAETIKKTVNDGKTAFVFDFPHALDSINLIATHRYKIVKDHFGKAEIFAYFFFGRSRPCKDLHRTHKGLFGAV